GGFISWSRPAYSAPEGRVGRRVRRRRFLQRSARQRNTSADQRYPALADQQRSELAGPLRKRPASRLWFWPKLQPDFFVRRGKPQQRVTGSRPACSRATGRGQPAARASAGQPQFVGGRR